MSSVQESGGGTAPVHAGEMKLEVVVVPVADVDRAKAFSESLGWRLDADLAVDALMATTTHEQRVPR